MCMQRGSSYHTCDSEWLLLFAPGAHSWTPSTHHLLIGWPNSSTGSQSQILPPGQWHLVSFDGLRRHMTFMFGLSQFCAYVWVICNMAGHFFPSEWKPLGFHSLVLSHPTSCDSVGRKLQSSILEGVMMERVPVPIYFLAVKKVEPIPHLCIPNACVAVILQTKC